MGSSMASFDEIFSRKCTSKGAFAISKLPFEDKCTFYYQTAEPTRLSAITELNGKSGFVFAPFWVDESHPILLLEDLEYSTVGLDWAKIKDVTPYDNGEDRADNSMADAALRQQYHYTFGVFHDALEAGRFQKLVLARRAKVAVHDVDVKSLFLKACKLYPRQHVVLFSSAVSGVWLMATPEILLSGKQGEAWRTMALAGTMKVGQEALAEWSEKNKKEQQVVADYIRVCLRSLASDVQMSEQYTTFTADLAHLRTDFTFRLSSNGRIGDVLERLHPTPAVCGMPKQAALQFIHDKEGIDRNYYSGFIGPLEVGGETRLYVSLRCMQLSAAECALYAGGGLLTESEEESEWQETEAKLRTMRQLLYEYK